ncbi:right-handed parallel beta-helix repeat-containing protein [Segetibacter aerophilus]|uniref:Right handed beta helix domain-containing protein n=1 Tax=Segetibacter aerophilus TaxID=670293 RepID=A0A512B9Y0_9BACT|nr:right-handed parallel beta-helix repeat-containing protein [Segetibacter aerophilus]GEO08749.1 hypothetical protein SAE01_12450 [Segetibacter aerophilus]
MKRLLGLILLFNNCFAATYYVTNAGSTGTGLDSTTNAWSYAKHNATVPAAGSIVLFHRGETYVGAFASRAGVTYGAYGAGVNPVITGLTQLSSWTQFSGNIYVADFDIGTTQLNLVTVDGTVKTMGRYPKSGYLSILAHTTNTSLTSATAIGFDATGGEAVIRKVRYILDRQPITAHSGNVLTLGTTSLYGGAVSRSITNNNGFFIQNNISCVTQDGDWYYDKTNKKFYMYFTSTPSGRVVKVSNVDKLVTFNSKSDCSFTGFDWEGSNTHAASLNGGTNITFTNCNFYKHGQTAIYGNGATNLTVTGGAFSYCLSGGVWVEQNGSSCTIDGVTMTNIALVAGSARSGDGTQQAININGETTTVKNSIIIKVGYNAINFNGSNALIEKNFIDSSCLVKDDGGAIYTYSKDVVVANRIVRNNIILHTLGNKLGAESSAGYENFGKAPAIYLDEGTNHTSYYNNYLSGGEWCGIFLSYSNDNSITNNLIFDFPQGLSFLENPSQLVRATTVTGNTIVSKSGQLSIYFHQYVADAVSNIGTVNNNIYSRPIDGAPSFTIDREYSGGGGAVNYSYANWLAQSGQDASSTVSALTASNDSKLTFNYAYPIASTVLGYWKGVSNTTLNVPVIPAYTAQVLVPVGYKVYTRSNKIVTRNGKLVVKVL